MFTLRGKKQFGGAGALPARKRQFAYTNDPFPQETAWIGATYEGESLPVGGRIQTR